ncbi:Ltp family lipoprotein [Oceanobacillus massiliensis]|uniref:Ltp family lipoprotein n=1 Tax=Oceanobacillus massiliensis TaxID=1465765 RepID=UPI00028946E0|nr:Ltp family lipoprotein [Oceanobacillus massiliensis]
MNNLFLLLFLISVLALIICLIKPNVVLRWFPEAKRSRKYVAMYFGIATVVFFILFGVTAPPTNESADNNEQIEQEKAEKIEEKEEEEEKAKAEEAEKKAEEEEQAKIEAEKKEEEAKAQAEAEKEPEMSLSQQNAIRQAESYLDYTAFSKSGLIDQLEYEGYPTEEAKFAVENIEVDWREQAVLQAQSYLDYTSFSRSGLIDQLLYEGHSEADATYAVDQVGL